MAPTKGTRSQRRAAGPRPGGAPSDPQTAAIYAMMAEADHLYKLGRYRRALAVCQKLARLDPKNALPEEMMAGCRRELRTRRMVLTGVLAVLLAIGAAAVFVYDRFGRLHASPEQGTVRLREREAQVFEFRSQLGYHRALEYAWRLLDGDGQPVAPTEEGTLAPQDGAPWARRYTPPYSLVRGDAGGRPAVRRIVVSGTNASGRQAAHAEWVVEVANVPLAPRVFGSSPPPDDLLSIVAGRGERAFRVEAADGDGGADLLYEWSVSGNVQHTGEEPAWTYRPPADALPPGGTEREQPPGPLLFIVCRVSNRYGPPMTADPVRWRLRLVRSNAPPQFIGFEPELTDLVRIPEGESRSVKANVYDPDEADTLTYRWECDGRVISRSRECDLSECDLSFPHNSTESTRTVPLTLTVTDSCGATATRSWQVHVVNAPRPETPPPD